MRSVLARTNPLVLLTAGLSSVVASVFVRDLPTAVVTLGCYLAAGALLVSWRVAWPRFATVGLASLSLVYSTWLLGGHEIATAATAGLRVVILGLPGAVLAAYVDPTRLADQLGQRLHLPARPVVAAAAALQRFDRLAQTWQQLSRVRRSRGAGPTRNPASLVRNGAGLTFALLVASLRDATQMSVAMDARGFAQAQRRTWAEPAPWSRTDTAVLLLVLALACVPVVLRVA